MNEMDKVCRLCLGENSNLIHVFKSRGVKGWTAADGITELLRIKVSADDIYPQCVCVNCFGRLEDFKLFKQQCERSKQLLDRAYAGKLGIVRSQKSTKENAEENFDEFYLKEEDVIIELGKDQPDVNEDERPLMLPSEKSGFVSDEMAPSEATDLEYNPGIRLDKIVGNCWSGEGTLEGPEEESMVVKRERIHCGEKPPKNADGRRGPKKIALIEVPPKACSKERPHKCEFCEKAFIQKKALTEHMRIHSGVKPYKCEFCNQGFRHISTLKSHLRIHSGEKPFECRFCGRAFSQRSTLNSHTQIHLGQKPFSCQICDKGFIKIDALKTHLRSHSGERPLKCKVCDKAFSARGTLRTHLKIHQVKTAEQSSAKTEEHK